MSTQSVLTPLSSLAFCCCIEGLHVTQMLSQSLGGPTLSISFNSFIWSHRHHFSQSELVNLPRYRIASSVQLDRSPCLSVSRHVTTRATELFHRCPGLLPATPFSNMVTKVIGQIAACRTLIRHLCQNSISQSRSMASQRSGLLITSLRSFALLGIITIVSSNAESFVGRAWKRNGSTRHAPTPTAGRSTKPESSTLRDVSTSPRTPRSSSGPRGLSCAFSAENFLASRLHSCVLCFSPVRDHRDRCYCCAGFPFSRLPACL